MQHLLYRGTGELKLWHAIVFNVTGSPLCYLLHRWGRGATRYTSVRQSSAQWVMSSHHSSLVIRFPTFTLSITDVRLMNKVSGRLRLVLPSGEVVNCRISALSSRVGAWHICANLVTNKKRST